MRQSFDNETKEIALSLISQIFYEETYQLMLVGLCRTFHGKVIAKEYY
jgi:hypothetical protein